MRRGRRRRRPGRARPRRGGTSGWLHAAERSSPAIHAVAARAPRSRPVGRADGDVLFVGRVHEAELDDAGAAPRAARRRQGVVVTSGGAGGRMPQGRSGKSTTELGEVESRPVSIQSQTNCCRRSASRASAGGRLVRRTSFIVHGNGFAVPRCLFAVFLSSNIFASTAYGC